MIIIGTVGILIFFLSAIAGVKIHARTQFILFLGAMLAMLVAIGVMLSTSHSAAVDMINKNLAGSGSTYDSIVSVAQENGYTLGWTLPQSLAALPYAYTFYWGFYNSNWYVGEIKGAAKSMRRAIYGSLLTAAVLAVLLAYLTFNVFGFDFYNGLNYLFFNAPSKYPQVVAVPYINYLLSLITDNPIIIAVILIGYVMNGLWQMISGVILATRQIFAWSFDRLIPARFSEVNERFHSPIWAVILMTILGEVAILLYAYTTISLYLVNSTIAWLICNLIVVLVCIIFPWRRKDLFGTTVPARWRRKIAGVPLLSWLSLIVLIPTVYMLYAAFTNAVIGGPLSYESMFVGVFGAMIFGIAVYFIASAYRKPQGIDLKMIFTQIPP